MSWKLKEIIVPRRKERYLVTGKFAPMDTSACHAGINISPIKLGLC